MIPSHVERFLDVNPQAYTLVAFNKADLVDENQAAAASTGLEGNDRVIATYKTSAKTGAHVDEIFEVLAHHMFMEKA